MRLRVFSRALADFLIPELCVVCGEIITVRAGPYPICSSCAGRIVPPRGKRCEVCSKPLISERLVCMECRKESYAFERNHSVFLYDETLKEIFAAYKGKGLLALKRFFAPELAKACKEHFNGLPLVPVPFRPESLRKRGYDQIGVLAEELRTNHGIQFLALLERTGKSLEQKSLDREARKANLDGKIRLRRRGIPSLGTFPEEAVLLDDVFTTGATANECAKVLKCSGVRRVFVLTLARD